METSGSESSWNRPVRTRMPGGVGPVAGLTVSHGDPIRHFLCAVESRTGFADSQPQLESRRLPCRVCSKWQKESGSKVPCGSRDMPLDEFHKIFSGPQCPRKDWKGSNLPVQILAARKNEIPESGRHAPCQGFAVSSNSLINLLLGFVPFKDNGSPLLEGKIPVVQ